MVFKKFPRAVLFERHRRDCSYTHRFECVADRRRLGRLPAGIERAAAFEKSGKRGGVTVPGPASEAWPLDRLVLRIRKLDRPEIRAVRRRRHPGQTGADGDQEQRSTTRRHRLYCPASVATTFQLGSREETSRANVHTSVTSVTFSASPSMTFPVRPRVAEMSLETKRMVICAVRARNSALVIVEPSIETNRVSAVSPRPSRSVIAASNPSYTSRESRLRNWRRSPSAKAVTIIS